MRQLFYKTGMIIMIIIAGATGAKGQGDFPADLRKGTITEQLKYLEDHTRIYENYRAVREDMFQAISKNTRDTLNNAKRKINDLIVQTTMLNNRIDSLNKSLETSSNDLNKITRTKNSISVMGLQLNKVAYNSFMWSLLGILVLLLILGYLTFKQNRITTLKTRKELDMLQSEFEEYKKKTRIEREKTNMDHFNEIKKLKGNLPNRG